MTSRPFRIAGTQLSHGGSHQSPSLVMITVSRYPSGEILSQIVLFAGDAHSTLDLMNAPRPLTPPGTDALPTGPIAGRIDAAPGDIEQAITGWLRHMSAVGKKPKSVQAFGEVVRKAVGAEGWSGLRDITYATITAYLERNVENGTWKRTTYNNRLSAFQSFTKWLESARPEHFPSNILASAKRADDDGGEGARAATLAEARAHIATSLEIESRDRRRSTWQTLYRMFEYAHGCRVGEPAMLRWKHVFLEHEIPHILWHKSIQKNKRTQEVPLCPELVTLLTEHRAAMRELAKGKPVFELRVTQGKRKGSLVRRKISPDDPEAFVFPNSTSSQMFARDRDRAGIPAVDQRGRAYTSHSARKFFSTVMTEHGVPDKTVDRLMRHRGTTESRYYDPPLAELAHYAAFLPGLWPGAQNGECGRIVDNSENRKMGERCLTVRPKDGTVPPLTPMKRHRQNSPKPPADPRIDIGVRTGGVAATAGSAEFFLAQFTQQLVSGLLPGDGRLCVSTCVMPITRLETPRSPNAVADFLESVARLLRSGAAHESQFSPASRPEAV